jgi:hypothetical protein
VAREVIRKFLLAARCSSCSTNYASDIPAASRFVPEGRASLRSLAERFQQFFVERSLLNKLEENPNRRIPPGGLAARSIRKWEQVIREQPVHYLTESFVIDEGAAIRWAPQIWNLWDAELKREIHAASFDRLVRYFNRNVPGGY